MTTLPSLMPALPEILLAIGAMALLMVGVFSAPQHAARTVTGLAVAILVMVMVVVLIRPAGGETFGGAFVMDAYAKYLKVLALGGSAVAIAMSVGYARAEKFDSFEYPVLIMLSTLGMMIMISARDLITVYMGVELMSLALYVIAAINRDNVRSTEAGLKYFVLGALSSGMLLYGMSLVYGFTGHTTFAGISEYLAAHQGSHLGLVFGLVFILAGLSFKVSAVPFHMWTPDVYEGAPTPVTAFFAAAPKVAAMAMFTRIVIEAFGPVTKDWQQIVVFISIASMALGAFAAIGQTNIKRLMAYSSIANMGFALVGLAAGTEEGVRGVILFMTIYLAMTLGVFACILSMRRKGGTVEDISDLAGLSRTSPIMAGALAMLMFSLIGIPPFAGFFAKYFAFMAAVGAGLWPLAILGVLASAVAAFYYLRLVKIMYFDEPAAAFDPMPIEQKVVLAVTGAFVFGFIFFPAPFEAAATAAAKSLF